MSAPTAYRTTITFTQNGANALRVLQERDIEAGGKGQRPDVINAILVWAVDQGWPEARTRGTEGNW